VPQPRSIARLKKSRLAARKARTDSTAPEQQFRTAIAEIVHQRRFETAARIGRTAPGRKPCGISPPMASAPSRISRRLAPWRSSGVGGVGLFGTPPIARGAFAEFLADFRRA